MEPIEFSSKSKTYSEFSNFHIHTAPFMLDNQQWLTVEHYFQAQKFPGDHSLQEQIRLASTPTKAKKLGRTNSDFFRRDWEQVKEVVMERALRAKFTQHEDLRTLLLSTAPRHLIEKAWWDSYWGSGRTGKGKNRMGALLERIRLDLNQQL